MPLLAVLAFALAASPSPIKITPVDDAIGVDPASTITVETPEPRPSIDVFEAVTGVRVPGKFEPFVACPNRPAVMRFKPTRGFKAGTTYKVLVGGRTFSFTTKAGRREILGIDDPSA
jgi:hypothetical protein